MARRGLADAVIFTGQRPAEEIPRYLDAATVLVSPRASGTNTPLKIYQYLRSGRPIVATRLRTHTQVLNDRRRLPGRSRRRTDSARRCSPRSTTRPAPPPSAAKPSRSRTRSTATRRSSPRPATRAICCSPTALPGTSRARAAILSRDHYFATQHYADPAVADEFDALRFGGPVGRYLLESQERLLVDALAPVEGQVRRRRRHRHRPRRDRSREGRRARRRPRCLGGNASRRPRARGSRPRHAGARARRRAQPAARGRQRRRRRQPARADARDRLAAVRRELCRVARWRVVVDYPSRASLAALESAARRLRQSLGARVEAYRVIGGGDLARTFAGAGFRVVRHTNSSCCRSRSTRRSAGSASRASIEGGLGGVGLLRLFGSPVTVVAERQRSGART